MAEARIHQAESKPELTREFIDKHFNIQRKIADLVIQQRDIDFEVLKQLVNAGEFDLLSINWNRVKSYYR